MANRAPWHDERVVIASVERFEGTELLRPLLHGQAFPRLHLIMAQWVAKPFGLDPRWLRFWATPAMLAAFMIWIVLYRRCLGANGWWVLAVLTFVSSYHVSYYAHELKPYAMDVFVVSLHVWFLWRWRRFEDQPLDAITRMVLVLFPWLMLLSYGALFVVWMPVWNMLVLTLNKRRDHWPWLVVGVISLLAAFVVFYFTDLQFSAHQKGLKNYWKNYFIRFDHILHITTPIWEGTREIATWWFGNSRLFIRLATIFMPLFFIGFFGLGWKALRKQGVLLMEPAAIGFLLYIELLVFSALGKYPFTGDRITLFLAPFVFLAMVRACQCLKKRWPRVGLAVTVGYGTFIMICLIDAGWRYVHM